MRPSLLLPLVVLSACGHALSQTSAPQRTACQPPRPEIDSLVQGAGKRHGLPAALILAVIEIESGFRPGLVSPVGARGLMQLMPGTAALMARELGQASYDVHDPAFNIEAGTAYLARLSTLFQGDMRWALAAYNAGPTRARRWRRDGQALPAFAARYADAVLLASTCQRRPSGNEARQDQAGLKTLLRQLSSQGGREAQGNQ